MYDVAIIGGGFSGVCAAYHLLGSATPGSNRLTCLLLEGSHPLGAGLAYRTTDSSHLLNVTASKMSISADTPDSFVTWLRTNHPLYGPDSYVPRYLYRAYLQDELRRCQQSHAPQKTLEIKQETARYLRKTGSDEFEIVSASGQVFHSRAVILALGNSPGKLPLTNGFDLLHDPFEPQLPEKYARARTIAAVGSGLTAIDVVVAAEHAGFTGHYTIVSKRGLLPHPHTSPPPLPNQDLEIGTTAVAESPTLRRAIRAFRQAVKNGAPWELLVDSLRPHSQMMWKRLTLAERRRYIRHLHPYWGSHRHRIPAQSGDLLASLKKASRLKVVKMAVGKCSLSADGIMLHGKNNQPTLGPFDIACNCMGLWSNLSRCESPLISSLIEQKIAVFDPLSLGFATDSEGALVNGAGQIEKTLFTLGSLRRGELWETTAAREIRAQTKSIAYRIEHVLTETPSS